MQHQPHHRFTTLLITLHGSDIARFQPLGLEAKNARGSVIADLSRKMIEAGLDPETDAMVMRGNTLCFAPMAIGHWAGLTVKEGVYHSARFDRWKQLPESVTGSSSAGVTPNSH